MRDYKEFENDYADEIAFDKVPDGTYKGYIDGIEHKEDAKWDRINIKLKVSEGQHKDKLVYTSYTIPVFGDTYFDIQKKALAKLIILFEESENKHISITDFLQQEQFKTYLDTIVIFEVKTSNKGYQNVKLISVHGKINNNQKIDDPFDE